MRRTAFIFLAAGLVVLAAAGILVTQVQASAPTASVPPDFVLIDSAPGVDLYRKDYAGGTPDYVLVVDLSKGAGIELLHGPIDGNGTGGGVYGGDNPGFARQSLQQIWDSFSTSNLNAVCVANGGFFETAADPAPLSLPLKVDGQLVSGGFWRGEFGDQKRMLEIWPDRVQISALTNDSLSASGAPDILGGLGENANVDSAALIGRTFVGLDDADENGSIETILLFSSKTTRTADAAGVLRSFGADDVLMLDGGDSSQLMCNNMPQVYSDRTIPQAIGITSGEQAAYAIRVKKQTDWAIVVEGKTLEIELTLTNTGSEIWRASEVTLINQRGDWGAGAVLNLPTDVPSAESVTFTWTTIPFDRTGISISQWDIARGSQRFNDRPISINVIIIPPELEDKKVELEGKIQEWARQQVEDMEALIMDWIQSQVRKGLETICPFGAVLPGAVIAGELWRKHRRRNRD